MMVIHAVKYSTVSAAFKCSLPERGNNAVFLRMHFMHGHEPHWQTTLPNLRYVAACMPSTNIP